NSRLITCGAPFGSSRAGREASGTHRARHPPALERRRRRQAGHLEDLLLVERIALEQRLHERVQLAAMLAQQAQRFLVAFLDDAPDLRIHEARGLLADGPGHPRPAAARVLLRVELHEAERIA